MGQYPSFQFSCGLSLNLNVLRLPVEPSRANYYEAGLTKALFGKFKLDANYFRRLLK